MTRKEYQKLTQAYQILMGYGDHTEAYDIIIELLQTKAKQMRVETQNIAENLGFNHYDGTVFEFSPSQGFIFTATVDLKDCPPIESEIWKRAFLSQSMKLKELERNMPERRTLEIAKMFAEQHVADSGCRGKAAVELCDKLRDVNSDKVRLEFPC